MIRSVIHLQDDANNLVRKLKDNMSKCNDDNLTMLEELKDLRKRNEELIYNFKECQTDNKAKINLLEGELNILRDQSSALNAQNIKLKQESEAKNQQLQENLPKISIIQPAIKGTGNEYFLLLLIIFALNLMTFTKLQRQMNARNYLENGAMDH